MGDGDLGNSTYVEIVKKGDFDVDSISRNHIKDNPLDGSQRNNTEEDVKKDNKPQTTQHLLSDWRTAIPSQPKIKQPGKSDGPYIREGTTGQLNTTVKILLFSYYL